MKKSMMSSPRICAVLFLLLVLCWATFADAEGIQARYLENSGTRTVLAITIEDPAPSSVIVTQHFPRGAELKSVQPAYTKFAADKNEAKWFFKQPLPGEKRLVIQYVNPISGKGATALIRCKNPKDGKLMTIRVE